MPFYAKLGHVCEWSEYAGVLLPVFADQLDLLRESLALPAGRRDAHAVSKRVGRLDSLLGEIEGRLDSHHPDDYFGSPASRRDLARLALALQGFAPPFAYFGTRLGPRTPYGFWVNWVAVERAVLAGSVLRVSHKEPWPEDELRERPGVEGVVVTATPDPATSSAPEVALFYPPGPIMPSSFLWSDADLIRMAVDASPFVGVSGGEK